MNTVAHTINNVVPLPGVRLPIEATQESPISTEKPLQADCNELAWALQARLEIEERRRLQQARPEKSINLAEVLRQIIVSKHATQVILQLSEGNLSDRNNYLICLTYISGILKPNEPVLITKLDSFLDNIENFPSSFVRQKGRKLFLEVGLLKNHGENAYRWASNSELLELAKVANSIGTRRYQLVTKARQYSPNSLIKKIEQRRLGKDPFVIQNADGSFSRVRKPFTPPYTEEEKGILRKKAEEQALAKVYGKKQGFDPVLAAKKSELKDRIMRDRYQRQSQWEGFVLIGRILLTTCAALWLIYAIALKEPPANPPANAQQGMQP